MSCWITPDLVCLNELKCISILVLQNNTAYKFIPIMDVDINIRHGE